MAVTALPTSSRPPWRPWWIALGLWLAIAAIASLALWHLRREELRAQSRELGLLSAALADEIERGLSGAEEGLHALRAELREDRAPSSGRELDRMLRTRSDLMPRVDTLWLLDRDGRVLASSSDAAPPALPAFTPPLDASLPQQAASLSRPFGAGDAQAPRVALAVRGGVSPEGWIVAALPARELLGAFGRGLPDSDARLAVFRADGVRLAGANVAPPTRSEAAVAQRLAQRPPLALQRFADGREHLVALGRVPAYGVVVTVSRDLASVLRPWRETAEASGIALALLMAVMAPAVLLLQRAERLHAEAQEALQAQRARAHRLESLATLAGGIGHDFNNVLAGIVGYAEMAREAAAEGSDQARHLDRLQQAATRGRALLERMLAAGRGDGGARRIAVFELEPLIDEVLTLVTGSLRPGIVLERVLQAPGACLRGDATRAFEALMNLCTNALQAMPDGGMLSVQLEREHCAAPRTLSHSVLAPGEHLVLSVTDQGHGIAADALEHLFEPFFTTRGTRGTGLGLAVVHGVVVTEFGGAIDVRSAPSRGARFTLYFPEHLDR